MKQFEVGSEYSMRRSYDNKIIKTYIVTHRTAKTVTIYEKGCYYKPEQKCRIIKDLSDTNGCETICPFGRSRYQITEELKAE